MALRLTVKDAETGNRIEMELQAENTVDEAIESACSYWSKRQGAFVLKQGSTILRGGATLQGSHIGEHTMLELIPDPQGGAPLA